MLTALTPLLGGYMARVYQNERVFLTPIFGPLERGFYRLMGVDPNREQDWKSYARTTIVFSALFFVVLYVILRTQGIWPFNPEGFDSAPADVSFNTTSSFITNTNWQFYGGETTMSYFSQMAGLAVQNFVSAAVGMAVLAAVIRGFVRRSATTLGNFWQDTTRTLLYILLPLSFVGALILVSQGVIQTLDGYVNFPTVQGLDQTLAMGPTASQVAIKQLGTNGGGFFNVNSSMPYENATAFSNFVEVLFILLIPAALTATFGRMAGNRRQGWALYGAMLVLFGAGMVASYAAEQNGSPAQHSAGLETQVRDGSTGGNMEGKEQRNGIADSTEWATATTDASNGSVNSAHDSYTGIGGLVPLANMMTGEVIFGGVGSGLYGMLLMVLLTVFIAGLMVGRTPEYLGKKIEAREMKLVLIGVLVVPMLVLVGDRAGGRDEMGRPVGLQPEPAGLLGDALRLHLAVQQQRLGVRGLHRLRAAQRPRQRRLVRHHLRRPARRALHAVRPLRAAAGCARRRRLAGRQAPGPRGRRHLPHRQRHLRRAAGRGDRDRRRADLLPGRAARAGRPGTHHPTLLDGKRHQTITDRNHRLHAAVRHRLPAGDDRRRAGAVPEQGRRQPHRARRQGRRLDA